MNAFGRSHTADDRRRIIVDAAARLFERRGFHGISMQDIADEVGITKAALYHYVKSKEQLLYEIHDAFVSTMIAEAEEFFPDHPDPDEQLQFLVRSIIEAVADYRPYVRAFFQDLHNLESEWFEAITKKRDEYESIVVGCLERGQTAGVFSLPNDDPKIAALFFFGACNWTYQWYQPRGELAPDQIVELWHHTLTRAFAAR